MLGDQKSLDVCHKGNISNCSKHLNASLCEECAGNYYKSLDSRSCELNPYLPISNCEIYETHSKCSICKNGFYLKNNTSASIELGCEESSPIENCQTFSQSEDKCEICKDGFFLSNLACSERTHHPIGNCEIYQTKEDKCQTCLENNVLSDDATFCGSVISNCETYVLSQNRRLLFPSSRFLQTKSLNCSICKTGFFLENNACPQQNLGNCQEYETNKNQCKTCQVGFFLTGTFSCETQNLQNCSEFTLNKNECSKCENLFYLSSTTCEPVSIQNCLRNVLNTNSCEQCVLNYHFPSASSSICSEKNSLKMPPQCVENDNIQEDQCTKCELATQFPYQVMNLCLPKNDGCQVMDAVTNKCQQCKVGYSGVDSDKTCVLVGWSYFRDIFAGLFGICFLNFFCGWSSLWFFLEIPRTINHHRNNKKNLLAKPIYPLPK